MASEAKVFIVDRDYKADYLVYFVDHDGQQMNHQLISPGELVDCEHKANVKVFIVDRDYKANIKITRENFPR